MKLNLKRFTGIMPRVDPKLLADNAAQTASNVNLLAGNLRPLNEPTVEDVLTVSAAGTIYDYYKNQYVMTCSASGSLATLQGITNGAFNIGIGGQTVAVVGCDFASAASFADCAAIIQAKIRSASGGDSTIIVTHNGTAFVFTSGFELTALTDFTGAIGNGWGTGTGTTTLSTNTSLTSTADGDIVVAQYGNLIINSGVKLTTSNRCKGLAVYVNGDLTLNGVISMTARGANVDPSTAGVYTTGIQIARITPTGTTALGAGSTVTGCGAAFIAAETANSPTSASLQTGSFFVIPTIGAAGGSKYAAGIDSESAANGSSGTILQSGGGGAGARQEYFSNTYPNLIGGSGAAGTCFSSGTGGGSEDNAGNNGGDGQSNGGSGGLTGGLLGTVSGAGNPTIGGTAGLLMVFVKGNIIWGTAGSLQSNGSAPNTSGGGSGGGIILCLYGGSITGTPVISVAGGSGYNTAAHTYNGGDGGAGSYILQQIQA